MLHQHKCNNKDLVPVTVKPQPAGLGPGKHRWWCAVPASCNWAHKSSLQPPKDSCWTALASKLLLGGLGLGFVCVSRVSWSNCTAWPSCWGQNLSWQMISIWNPHSGALLSPAEVPGLAGTWNCLGFAAHPDAQSLPKLQSDTGDEMKAFCLKRGPD